jgi:hypothetical protein
MGQTLVPSLPLVLKMLMLMQSAEHKLLIVHRELGEGVGWGFWTLINIALIEICSPVAYA